MTDALCKHPGCGRPVYRDGICLMLWTNQIQENKATPVKHEVAGKTFKQVADILGITESAVYQRWRLSRLVLDGVRYGKYLNDHKNP